MIGFLWREDTKFQWYNKKIVTLYSAIEKYLSKCLQIKKINYLCAVKWDARQKISLQVIISKYYGK